MLSPIRAAAEGALAGLAGSVVFSLMTRIVPAGRTAVSSGGRLLAGLSVALVQAEAPGPEGLAAQFGFKIAAGLFGKDVSSWARELGFLYHLTYGMFWGELRNSRGELLSAVGPRGTSVLFAWFLLHLGSQKPGKAAAGMIPSAVSRFELDHAQNCFDLWDPVARLR